MIRKKINFQNVFLLIGALLILPLIAIATISQTNLKDNFEDETDYVTEEVITDTLPVVNTTTRIIDPYTDTYGVNPLTVTVSAGQVVMTFNAQENDMLVGIGIK